mmetsp:Transcript_12342/g.16962  ORF Transcript_12342/g.16962 Transcript_12342/m.16962 type:complete len:377 (-) Transcript_12342:341-1471(-)|eukprot:CAMPEP_0201092766 /NCGR_PEP_ID=MMETSP0812-20130820/1315_1 /ASSEMBLY_ACC=CAM_ASM_000668 /TAXON_ID=98059 /ORGANISM="Dinobryon sp., Strain UTEXLB2267" /LENGTH=376 /DNA_ID=CAMNT_0047344527 /DNA_START=43 /DNA_END=1173 /DNA_ORIENTATION=+
MSDNGGYTVPIVTETSPQKLEDMNDQQRDHITCEFNPSPSSAPSADTSFISVDSKLDTSLNNLENFLNTIFFLGHETPKPWYLNFSGMYTSIKEFSEKAIVKNSAFESALSILESATAFSHSRFGYPLTGSFVDIFANFSTAADGILSKFLLAFDHRFDEARLTLKEGLSIVIGHVIQQGFWFQDFVQQSRNSKDPSKVNSFFQTPLEIARIALSYLHEKFPDVYDVIELGITRALDFPSYILRTIIKNAWLLKVMIDERKDFFKVNFLTSFSETTHAIDVFFYRQAVWLLQFLQPIVHSLGQCRESLHTFIHPYLVPIVPYLEPISVKIQVWYSSIQNNTMVGPLVHRLEEFVTALLTDAGLFFHHYNPEGQEME